jgi:putative exporter of polyketide antibiotics
VPPGFIGAAYQIIRYKGDLTQPYYFNVWTVLTLLALLALIYIISSLSFALRIRRDKPVDIIRRWE